MSATKAELLALAERVEALAADDWRAQRTLAKDLYRQLNVLPDMGRPNGYGWREDDSGWWCETGEDQRTPRQRIDPPRWLTSLDAAITLVPEGWMVSLDGLRRGGAAVVLFSQDKTIPPARATAPALALTAAALRARSHGEPA
jgi:hypothetical protein